MRPCHCGAGVLVLMLGLQLSVPAEAGGQIGGRLRGNMRQSQPQPIRAVPFLPVGNARNWILIAPLVYRVGTSEDSVVVPAGFVTDFASIPQAFQSLFSQLGPHLLPAVVHDYLYWEQSCTREQADRIFLLAMEEMRVPTTDRTLIYGAVRTPAGQLAWDNNRRDRAAGLPRIVPLTQTRSITPLETWPDYRRSLRDSGIRPGSPARISPAFCRHGGSG